MSEKQNIVSVEEFFLLALTNVDKTSNSLIGAKIYNLWPIRIKIKSNQ